MIKDKITKYGFRVLCMMCILVVILCENLRGQDTRASSIHQIEIDAVEIVSYRIIPSSHPSLGCWSELELMGESMMSEEVRDELIHEIIMIELYFEVPEYIMIEKKSYLLLRLPIMIMNYNYGDIDWNLIEEDDDYKLGMND